MHSFIVFTTVLLHLYILNHLTIKPFSMQRYNIFHLVHKGLRALLYETALQVQHTDFWNVEQAEQTIDRIKELIKLFDKHADTEDSFVFPAVEKYEPSVSDAFEQEHVKDHILGQLLSSSLALYKAAAIITDKAESGKQVQSAFMKFMFFNLEHMAKEEDVLNNILWRYYSDDELKAITEKIVAKIPAEYMAKFSKWMIRGLNTPEITAWMKQVEKTAPDFVFKSLFATAEEELSRKRFREVVDGLTEGAMMV